MSTDTPLYWATVRALDGQVRPPSVPGTDAHEATLAGARHPREELERLQAIAAAGWTTVDGAA